MNKSVDPIFNDTDENMSKRVEIANKKFLRTRNQLLTVMFLFATAALLVAGFALRSLTQVENLRNSDAQTNGQKIDQLNRGLADAQSKLLTEQQAVASAAASVAVNAATQLNEGHQRDVCTALYDAETQATFQQEFTTIAKVVIAGFSTAPAPSPDRSAAIDATLKELAISVQRYDRAIQDKKDYIAGGSVLPCPLDANSVELIPVPTPITTTAPVATAPVTTTPGVPSS